MSEYHLLVYPVVLGSGKRLFGAGAVPAVLKLASTRTTSTGAVISSYLRAGRPSYGSFALDSWAIGPPVAPIPPAPIRRARVFAALAIASGPPLTGVSWTLFFALATLELAPTRQHAIRWFGTMARDTIYIDR